MVLFTFGIFKLMLALIALLAMTIDFIRHRELKYIFVAYFCLVMSAGVIALQDFYSIVIVGTAISTLEDFYYNIGLDFAFHFFGITMAGLLFAKTAYSSNSRIIAIKQKTRRKFK
jgi:uncharacterized sodium:solute symporter family permease YidK